MKTTTAIAIISLFCTTLSRAADENKPAQVEISQLSPEFDGAEVVMTFKVANCYRIGGAVPKGRVPTFGIEVVVAKSDPRFSVCVSEDLADAMGRFGYGPTRSKDNLNGLVIEAQGKIRLFPAPQDNPEKGPSYNFIIEDWKRFRFKE